MSDDEVTTEQEEMLYEFVATGGETCERCKALGGGRWPGPPDPPHAHCECEIVPRPAGFHEPRACGDNAWTLDPLPNASAAHYEEGFELGFVVTVDCWDGLSHEFEIWVDMGSIEEIFALTEARTDPALLDAGDYYDTMMALAWNEVYDEAEMVLAQVCTPCEPRLVS